jgi:EmrB/QacA subfamily drug resistance transporter
VDQAVAQESRPTRAVPGRGLVLAAALMATFMAAVESTIVATAMPTIVADLGGFGLFSWVFAAYLLTMAVTIPIYGRLADIYGRKPVFYAGTAIFLVGTLLCGFATSMGQLILFRALQGAGGGAIQPITATIVGDIYTPAERARVQGYISSVFGVSAIVGPALGAFLVEHWRWSFVFWINLPIGLGSVVMFALFLHEKIERREHRIDYAGAALLVVGAGSLLLALVQAASLARVRLAALAAVGLAALAFFFVHERRTAEPMMPFALWRRRIIALSNLGVFGTGSTLMGVSAFLPTYVQAVMGKSPGIAGFVLGCTSVSWMFASIAAGRLMNRTSYRLTATLGGVFLLAGGIMLAALDPSRGPFWASVGTLLLGIGMGGCNTTFIVSIQASVTWGERGVATGANMFMRMIGQATGAALFGAVLNWGIAWRLPGEGDAVNRLLNPGLRAQLDPAAAAHLIGGVAGALHVVYLIVALIAAATLSLSLALPPGLSPTRPASPAG